LIPTPRVAGQAAHATLFPVLAAISVSHLLNDTIQSLIPAIYPILKSSFQLTFTQIGLITLTLQLTASIFQPLVGLYTDRRPTPYSLVGGMGVSLVGLLVLSIAPNLAALLVAAALIGLGSAVFHPESSRVARMASGGQHGLAQSIFQVGGNFGSSLGSLLAAFVVAPRGQQSIAWCSLVAAAAMVLLWKIGGWYRAHIAAPAPLSSPRSASVRQPRISRRRMGWSMAILVALIFSKYFYLVSLNSFYTFYLMSRFQVPVQRAQLDLFTFLAAVAAGTILGGPIGDRFGRKWVIWISIVGALPFTLLLPYSSLFWTRVLAVVIGVVIASAFSAILVYAQELLPDRVGLIAGLFFGFAFGVAGVGAAALGRLADHTSIEFVYRLCAFLPLIGLLTGFLPDVERRGA
jgi:FSR family fosmidomycin resistance protein-like MFS transporter